MIVKMITMPTIPKTTSSSQSGLLRKPLTVAGTRDTMPAKMMKLMPLPIPFSVISSPNHINTMEPVVRAMICVHDS